MHSFSSRRSAAVAAAALSVVCLISTRARGQLAAFPGAEGFGADATGGRSGNVVLVTNLNASGTGSFTQAVGTPNSIVVFAVGGYINLGGAEVSVAQNVTILGQTAPGGGIGLMNGELAFSHASLQNQNDIVEYLRIRQGDAADDGKAAIEADYDSNIIIDHTSVQFGEWDTADINNSTGITIQNSILSDAIGQQFGIHAQNTTNFTLAANLFATNHNRNPFIENSGSVQMVNNVIYNTQAGVTGGNTSGTRQEDIVNNYFIQGPAKTSGSDTFYQVGSNDQMYASGNMLDANEDGVLNGSPVSPSGVTALSSPWATSTQFLPTLSAANAYNYVAAEAGASLTRDQLDSLDISQLESLGTTGGTTANGDYLYTHPSQSGLSNGGYGTISGGTAPTSSANDGIPDSWALTHGVNQWAAANGTTTTNAAFAMVLDPLGYTEIEDYANQLAGRFPTMTWSAAGGDWSTANWSAGPTWTATTPSAYVQALVRGTGATNGSLSVSTTGNTAESLSIGGNGPAAGESVSVVSGGALSIQDTIFVGDQNNATLNISGGTVTAGNVQLGDTVYDSNGNPTNYTGTFNFTGGTLAVGQVILGAGTPGHYTTGGVWNWNGGTLEAFGNLNVNAPATLSGTGAIVNTVGPDGVTYSATMSGVLSGGGGFTKQGAGTLTFASANTYTGPTAITGGAIQANVTNAIGPNSTITISTGAVGLDLANGVTIASPIVVGGNTASEFADAPGSANATLAGPISLTGSSQLRLGDSGTGTLSFTGTTSDTASYSFITKGNITFSSGGVLNDTATSGGLVLGRNASEAVNLTVTGTNSAINISRIASGAAGLTIGSGSTSYENPSVTLNIQSGGAVNVGVANVNLDADPTTASGTISTLNLNASGTLTAGGFTDSEAGVNAAKFVFNGGTLVADGNDPSGGAFLPAFNGLTAAVGSGGANVNDGGYSITIDQPLVSGVTSGTDGGFTKSGSGTIYLAGGNTYNGKTTVLAGTLDITGSIANNGSASVLIAADPTGSTRLLRTTAANASYDGLGSSVTSGLLSRADLVQGENLVNNPTGESVTMSWRLRQAGETPAANGGSSGLISEVMTLTGMNNVGVTGNGQTDPFALQMNFSPSLLASTGPNSLATAAAAGRIQLDTQILSIWTNATLGNYGVGTDVQTDVQSSWSTFASQYGITDANVGNYLGSWGVDTADDQVWAVVDHNSSFAVGFTAVPEPAAATLLMTGVAGLAMRRRRQ